MLHFGEMILEVRLKFFNRHIFCHPHTFPRLSSSVNAATFRCMPASLALSRKRVKKLDYS